MLYEVITHQSAVEGFLAQRLHPEGAADEPSHLQQRLGPYPFPTIEDVPAGRLLQYDPLLAGKGKRQATAVGLLPV